MFRKAETYKPQLPIINRTVRYPGFISNPDPGGIYVCYRICLIYSIIYILLLDLSTEQLDLIIPVHQAQKQQLEKDDDNTEVAATTSTIEDNSVFLQLFGAKLWSRKTGKYIAHMNKPLMARLFLVLLDTTRNCAQQTDCPPKFISVASVLC